MDNGSERDAAHHHGFGIAGDVFFDVFAIVVPIIASYWFPEFAAGILAGVAAYRVFRVVYNDRRFKREKAERVATDRHFSREIEGMNSKIKLLFSIIGISTNHNFQRMEIYAQRDPRWRDMRLGESPYTMGGYGCTVTAVAQALTHAGWGITPGQLCEALNRIGGFTDAKHQNGPGLLIWKKVGEAFPQFHFQGPGYNLVSGVMGKLGHWVLQVNGEYFDPWTGTQSIPAGFYNYSTRWTAAIDPYVAPTPPVPPAPPAPEPPAPQPMPSVPVDSISSPVPTAPSPAIITVRLRAGYDGLSIRKSSRPVHEIDFINQTTRMGRAYFGFSEDNKDGYAGQMEVYAAKLLDKNGREVYRRVKDEYMVAAEGVESI